MSRGKGDNRKALLFVRAMRYETLKRIEDEKMMDAHEEEEWMEDQEDGGSEGDDDGVTVVANKKDSVTSKIQQKHLPAKAKDAGKSAEETSGQVGP